MSNIKCQSCGSGLNEGDRFCSKCEGDLAQVIAAAVVDETQPKKKNVSFFGMFNISEAEMDLQVAKHDTLQMVKSSRGRAALIIMGLLLLGIAVIAVISYFSGSSIFSYSDLIWSMALYLPLLYFVSRGHMWAMMILAALYTFDKFYTPIAIGGHPNISTFIFWMMGAGPLWVAFRVEREYRKSKKAAIATVEK